MTTGISPQVSRRTCPKPQVLTELGDKASVIEFLMAEYMWAASFQVIDAPVLVVFLLGDHAARSSCIPDAFRNAHAMRELERLVTDIGNEVVFEADVAKYQERYDRIGKEADLTATAYEAAAREWVSGPPARPSQVSALAHEPPPAKVLTKVMLGDTWRSKRHENALLKVTGLGSTAARLEGVGRQGNVGVMSLDENGFCEDPNDNWTLVSRSLPKVEIGQTWSRPKPEGGRIVRRVTHIGVGQLGKTVGRYCVLSADGGRPEDRYSEDRLLNSEGCFLHPDGWELVEDPQVTKMAEAVRESGEHFLTGKAEEPQYTDGRGPKVEVGQPWLRRDKDGTVECVVTTVDGDAALLSTAEPGTIVRMPLRDGFCYSPSEWSFRRPPITPARPATHTTTSPAFSLRDGGYQVAPLAPVVEYGQLWYQKIGDGGRQGKVSTGVLHDEVYGHHVMLQGHVEMFVMRLDEHHRPLNPQEWSFVRSPRHLK